MTDSPADSEHKNKKFKLEAPLQVSESTFPFTQHSARQLEDSESKLVEAAASAKQEVSSLRAPPFPIP